MIEHEENSIFDLLSQLLMLGLHENIFVAAIKDVANVYKVQIPAQVNEKWRNENRTQLRFPRRKGGSIKRKREERKGWGWMKLEDRKWCD